MLPNFHRSFESEEKKEFLRSPRDRKIERIRERSVSLSVESHWSIVIFHGGFFGPAAARNCLMKPPRLGTAWKEGRNVAVGQGETPAFTSSRQRARVPRERLPRHDFFFPSPSVVLLPVRMFTHLWPRLIIPWRRYVYLPTDELYSAINLDWATRGAIRITTSYLAERYFSLMRNRCFTLWQSLHNSRLHECPGILT